MTLNVVQRSDQLVQAIDVDKVPFNKSSEVIAFYQSLGNLTDTFPMAFGKHKRLQDSFLSMIDYHLLG